MKINKKTIITILILLSAFLVCDYCFARAGGGGGGGGGGSGSGRWSILGYILAPIIFIYSIIMTVVARRKNEKVKKLLGEISKKDAVWNLEYMTASAQQIFYIVQKAWTNRNQDIAREYMSNNIYTKHSKQTDEMVAKGTKNILEEINLDEVLVYSISDFKNDSFDTFSAIMTGSMIDYSIDKKESIISGSDSKSESFKEIWIFIRKDDKWVLDEIKPEANLGDINAGSAFSEQ